MGYDAVYNKIIIEIYKNFKILSQLVRLYPSTVAHAQVAVAYQKFSSFDRLSGIYILEKQKLQSNIMITQRGTNCSNLFSIAVLNYSLQKSAMNSPLHY